MGILCCAEAKPTTDKDAEPAHWYDAPKAKGEAIKDKTATDTDTKADKKADPKAADSKAADADTKAKSKKEEGPKDAK